MNFENFIMLVILPAFIGAAISSVLTVIYVKKRAKKNGR